MDVSFDAHALVFLGAAALLSGLAKGFSGFGAALVFMPLASAAVGPVLAAPIFIVIDCITCLPLARSSWALADRRAVARIGLAACLGLPVGIYILMSVDQTLIRWAISLLCLASVSLLVFGWRFDGGSKGFATVFTGIVSGIFHGIAQISGPPVLLLWIAEGHAKEKIRANALLYFACLTILTLVTFVVIGISTWATLAQSMILLPIYAGGLLIGARLFRTTSDLYFRGISYSLIVAAAILGLPALDHFLRG